MTAQAEVEREQNTELLAPDSGIIQQGDDINGQVFDEGTTNESGQERQTVDSGGAEEGRRTAEEDSFTFRRRIEKVFNGAGRIVKTAIRYLLF